MKWLYDTVRELSFLIRGKKRRESYYDYMPPDRAASAGGDARCTLRIRYVDERGNRTQRDIAIYPLGATDRRFQAYCSLRRDTRDFLFERIERATDLDTGEILTQADVFRRVHPGRRVPAGLV